MSTGIPASEAPQGLRLYGAVGSLAGAVIALQIAVMRVFAVGSWSHFGSLVVSLAMLGFGMASVFIFVLRGWLDRHGEGASRAALVLFGPLAVGANLVAQLVPFNAIFLISDPMQKWRLLANFLLYLLPFLSGAFFLGIVFRQGRAHFNRLYFADLLGSGLAGLAILGALYILPPEKLLVAPLVLWAVALILWSGVARPGRVFAALLGSGATLAAYLILPAALGVPAIAVSSYKGVSYARNFPDAKRLYRDISPFGDLQIYSSSYMHFAPGLSDNAAFNVPELPANTYVGMFIDGEGPSGIMRPLPPEDAAYYQYLPMYYPYVIKTKAKVFVAQFGGGLSAMTALNAGATSVTIAESNPEVLRAFRAPELKEATGNILADPRVTVVGYDGRLFLTHTDQRYDVIDLSLADSVGLSNPGGFAITEKYAYTQQALEAYINGLAPGGVLSVTLWNKEEPPKSVLRFYATMVRAAKAMGGDWAGSLFVSESYLSTTTVLYKKGGFTADEIAALRGHTADLSFDEVYSPGFAYDPASAKGILQQYQDAIFGNAPTDGPATGATDAPGDAAAQGDGPAPGDGASADGGADAPGDGAGDGAGDGTGVVPSTTLARLVWQGLVQGGAADVTPHYVFDVQPLTDDRPYFAGYIRPADLTRTLDRLDTVQDDWGYLLLWATLGIACLAAAVLILPPMVLGGRMGRGKPALIVYFGCLGLGYITVEVGLISWFARALTNPTIAASVVLSGMLVFSGLGAWVAERIRSTGLILPALLGATALALALMTAVLPGLLEAIGALPYLARLVYCLALVAPVGFLMGFPMATAMNALAECGRDQMFVWAWGINGSFSVVGAAAVPLIAVSFGLSAVLEVAAASYALALPAYLSMLRRA
ncbi:hypothetical protein GC209_08050 [bacterium]|nr:hypothetical protein [bacterium]